MTGGFNLLVCLDEEHSGAATPTESLIMRVGGTPYSNYRNGGMWVPVEAVIG